MGLLFDWDGVIIDSSAHHEESWNRLAQERGFKLPADHFLKGFGMKNEIILSSILNWSQNPEEILQLSLHKEVLYRQIIQEWGIAPMRGLKILLDRLQDEKIPCAIASSTHRQNITTTLEILGLENYFQKIVSAEDVKQGKPDPEVFLLAAKSIGCEAKNCIVIEDAPMGIEAALAGGIKAIGITTTHPKTVLAKAHLVIRRLDELDIHRLEGLFA